MMRRPVSDGLHDIAAKTAARSSAAMTMAAAAQGNDWLSPRANEAVQGRAHDATVLLRLRFRVWGLGFRV